MYMLWTSLMLLVAFICDYTIYMLTFTCNCPRISIFSLSLSTLTLCWLLSDIIPSISAMEPLGQTADPVFTLGTRSGCDLRYSLAFKLSRARSRVILRRRWTQGLKGEESGRAYIASIQERDRKLPFGAGNASWQYRITLIVRGPREHVYIIF